MTKAVQQIVKILIVICLTAGVFLLSRNAYKKQTSRKPHTHSMSATLKKYFLANEKPQRIEILSYTKRFEKDVQEIKKMKIAQNSQATFYATVQFFTDESDLTAPLIAQIRFIDLKSGNQIKEESLNLE